MKNKALGIIDAQRGFMPAAEGLRLGYKGFGELPVDDGERIVPALNRLLSAFAIRGLRSFTTQDWHPLNTAHFSDTPDFVNNWPRHCVSGTDGAKLHPFIDVPESTRRFVKGFEPLMQASEDLSYSGFYAEDEISRQTLPEALLEAGVDTLYLGGLALDYCVGKTALDFREKLGLDVIVAIDATRGISEQSSQAMLAEFARAGVETSYADQIIQDLRGDDHVDA